MDEKIEKKRYNGLDIFKFIMAIFVVAIHTDPIRLCTNTIIRKTYFQLVDCAVPFFFICSGFLLGMKIKNKNDLECRIEGTKKYLLKIIKMYLLWMLIYFPLTIYGYIQEDISLVRGILLYIRGFFFIGEHYNSWMMWYLLSTIYSLIFIIICSKLKLSIKSICAIGTFIILMGFGMTELVNSKEISGEYLLSLKKLIQFTLGNGRIFQGFFYIPLGMTFFGLKDNFVTGFIIFALSYFANYFVDGMLDKMVVVMCSIGIFLMAKNIKLKDKAIYSYLRTTSTVMYFIHMYIWTIFYSIKYGARTYGVDVFVATTILSIIASIVFIVGKNIIRRKAGHKVRICV